MALGGFILWMLPWIGLALVALYAGYVAYQTQQARAAAPAAPPPGPDPVDELERLHTEMSRALATARVTLEKARETVQRGTRG